MGLRTFIHTGRKIYVHDLYSGETLTHVGEWNRGSPTQSAGFWTHVWHWSKGRSFFTHTTNHGESSILEPRKMRLRERYVCCLVATELDPVEISRAMREIQ